MIDTEDEKENEKDNLISDPYLNEIDKDRIPLFSVYWILSIIYWILFILTGISAIIIRIIIIKSNKGFFGVIWSYINSILMFNLSNNYYLVIENNTIYALFIITLIFAAFEFIYFLIKSTFKRDYNIYDSMMGNISKYHFIPLLLTSCFFGIGIYCNFIFELNNISNIKYDKEERDKRKKQYENLLTNINIYGIIFSILILTSSLIINNKIKIKNETFLNYLLIKKGTFSCLISLSIYTLFNNIFNCIIDFTNIKERKDGFFSIFFHLTIGILNLVLSVIFKDIILPVMNFIIYLGMTLDIFSFWKRFESRYEWNQFANASIKVHLSIDIIIMILSIFSLILVIFRIKNN